MLLVGYGKPTYGKPTYLLLADHVESYSQSVAILMLSAPQVPGCGSVAWGSMCIYSAR